MTGPPELLVALQGKFVPASTRGLLSGFPYGGGVSNIMCALAAERRANAEAERMALKEGMMLFCVILFRA